MATFSLYQHAEQLLRQSQRPLFVVSKDLDGDALGSSMALARSLQLAGKQVRIITGGKTAPAAVFLKDSPVQLEECIEAFPVEGYDSLVLTDSQHLTRTGFAEEMTAARRRGIPLLSIDHHPVHGEPFADVSLVSERASSSSELVYDLIKLGGWPIDAFVATALLAGITYDTGNFTNAATTPRSLEIAAACYAKGADARRVIRDFYHGRELNALKLWGTVLARLKKHQRWGLVSTMVLNKDLADFDLSEEAMDGFANFMNTISDMRASLILRELPTGEIRGSLRTTRDDVDVSKFAKLFGGGGHKKAAGFTIPGRIIQADGRFRVEASKPISWPPR